MYGCLFAIGATALARESPAVNGVVRGIAVAVTQAVLGANPLTGGIGLLVPDAVILLTQKNQLSEETYNQKATEVVAKGALSTALVCAGPVSGGHVSRARPSKPRALWAVASPLIRRPQG